MRLSALATEVVERCILCSRRDYESDYRFSSLLALEAPYDVKRCRNCGLAWLSPRPTQDSYSRLYRYDSYFEGDDAVECYADLAAGRRSHFRKRLESVKSLLSGRDDLRLLDIGAATGEFVHEAMTLGFKADGIEISDGARKQAAQLYGISLLKGPLSALKHEPVYDVVHLNHVLEHMADPLAILDSCFSLLKAGGLLVLEVPQQFENDIERIKYGFGLKKPEFNLYSLHHTYFFTPANLNALIEKSGFRVIQITTENPSRTPLKPFSWRNLLLRYFLLLSDRLHRGGNIIEVYAKKL